MSRKGVREGAHGRTLIFGGGFELRDFCAGTQRAYRKPTCEKGNQAIMKRAILALAAVTLVASSTGCCCLDRLFCWGCRGSCPYGGCGYYGNEGPGCGGCGGGGCSDCGSYGSARGGGGPAYARRGGGPGAGPMMAESGPMYPPRTVAPRRPAGGHPLVHQRRDAGGEYEFAAGPPTGGTTYPYYTTRGPRDFLARNPRDIGP